jgi:hypothetical protein
VLHGSALVACIVAITWSGIRGWTDRWTSLAEWLVAAGTLGLAAATYWLARRAREEAQAVRKESDRLGDQARAVLRAYVYPESSAEWAQARGEWTSVGNQWALPLRNGGPGLALNVAGSIKVEGVEDTTPLVAGSIASGRTLNARPAAPVAGWGKVSGELRYRDLNGDEWVTRFRMLMSEGESGQLYAEHDPPELVASDGVDGSGRGSTARG